MNTTVLLDENEFWIIIENTLERGKNDYEMQQEVLKEILLQFEPIEIVKFENRFRQLSNLAYCWELWGAAYIINGGCSDDCFDDFRGWLIAKGKDKFYQIIQDPENLVNVNFVPFKDDFEGFSFIPRLAYEKLTDKEMPEGAIFRTEIKGIEWDEESSDLEKMFPRLYAKYDE